MVVTGILSSHPGLIGAAKRLIPAQLCEVLASSMRAQCQQVQASQSRQWMHFSYPYTCRVCVVHCTALYCCVVNNRDFNRDALERLHKVQFHGMLQLPPQYLLDSLSLESAVVLSGVGSGEPKLMDSLRSQAPTSAVAANRKQKISTSPPKRSKMDLEVVPTNESGGCEVDSDDVSYEGGGGGDGSGDPVEKLSPQSKARYRMITVGVFHNAHSVPEAVARKRDSIAIGDVEEADYEGCVRNVEYMAFMTRKEKDHIMSTLFKMFNVE